MLITLLFDCCLLRSPGLSSRVLQGVLRGDLICERTSLLATFGLHRCLQEFCVDSVFLIDVLLDVILCALDVLEEVLIVDFLPLVRHKLPQYSHVIKLVFKITLSLCDAILDLDSTLVKLIEYSLLLSLLFDMFLLVEIAVVLMV